MTGKRKKDNEAGYLTIGAIVAALPFAGFLAGSVYFFIKGEIGGGLLLLGLVLIPLIVILATQSQSLKAGEEEFTYGSFFCRKRTYRYEDVIWRQCRVIHVKGRSFTISLNDDDGVRFHKKLDLMKVPDTDPTLAERITDERGEHPIKVIRRQNWKLIAWIMAIAGLIPVGLLAATYMYEYSEGTLTNIIFLAILMIPTLLFGGIAALACGTLMFEVNGRAELYKDGFIYRDWRGKRLWYSYSDAVSGRKTKNSEYIVVMRDGKKLRFDEYMMDAGIRDALKWNKLPEE
ncbi:MAG: hypothetical protein K6G56_00895 [Clostridiales bacterium]|nr:hypothetical protein [Clostridiales bacterium]